MGAPGRQLRRLLRGAHQRWPESFVWPWLLAISYVRLTWSAPRQSEARRRYAAEALRWLELEDSWWPADESVAAEYRHLRRSGLMAQMAFEVGDLERAGALANETQRIPEVAASVRRTPGPGNWMADPSNRAVHDGHIVLGKIALARGDLDEASRRLHLAGEATSFADGAMATLGPDLSLAQDLLDRSRTDEVLDYLLGCRDAWILGRREIDRWVRQIRSGRVPRLEVRRFPPLRSQIEVFSTVRLPRRPA